MFKVIVAKCKYFILLDINVTFKKSNKKHCIYRNDFKINLQSDEPLSNYVLVERVLLKDCIETTFNKKPAYKCKIQNGSIIFQKELLHKKIKLRESGNRSNCNSRTIYTGSNVHRPYSGGGCSSR